MVEPGPRRKRRYDSEIIRKFRALLKGEVGVALAAPSGLTKTVLVWGMQDVPSAILQSSVINGFVLAGYKPIVVLPYADPLSAEIYKSFDVNEIYILEKFIRGVDSHGIANDLVRDIQAAAQLIECRWEGIPVGKFALSSLMRITRLGSFDLRERKTFTLLRHALSNSIEFAVAARYLLAQVSPDAALFIDRGYTPCAELFYACVDAGVPSSTWNAGHKDGTLILKRYTEKNREVHPCSLSQENWEQLKNMRWQDDHWRALRSELVDCYRSGKWYSEVGTQFDKVLFERDDIYYRLGLDRTKKVAVIFSHIFWDGTFFWGDDLFGSYEEWFVESVKVACRNDNLNWVVKVHPANLVKDRRDGIRREASEMTTIRDKVGTLPPHIKVLPAETEMSTLSLYHVADYALTVRGTSGIEAACFGIRVLTAGTGRYDKLGFTLDSDSSQEYLARLDSIQNLPRPSVYETELARRFAYGIFIARPLQVRALDFRYDRDETASLQVGYKLTSRDQLRASSDLVALADWISSGKEDFFDRDVVSTLTWWTERDRIEEECADLNSPQDASGQRQRLRDA